MKNKRTTVILLLLLLALIPFVSNSFLNEETDIDYEWNLTFEDNFDAFDSTKWLTHFDMGNKTIWSNKELQWYQTRNIVAEDGVLKIIAKRESVYGKDAESEKQFEYTSGMINTPRTFTQAYGKWETRIRFPFRKGFWPAFWLVAKQRPGLPEIDVFEYFGINEHKIYCNHHWGIDFPNYSGGAYEGKTAPFYYRDGIELTGDYSDQWMVWSFECFPNIMRWKLNGKTVYEDTKGIPTAPLYVIANVAVKDWEANNFVVDDSEPFVMEIDYVRIYQMVPKGR